MNNTSRSVMLMLRRLLICAGFGGVFISFANAQTSDAILRELSERLATDAAPQRAMVEQQLIQSGLAAVPFVANLIPAKEPGARDAAVRVLQQIGMEAALAHCINSLNSPNEQVRYRAANALSLITNRHFGYSPQDTPARRAQIIARWNKWWLAWQNKQTGQQQ